MLQWFKFLSADSFIWTGSISSHCFHLVTTLQIYHITHLMLKQSLSGLISTSNLAMLFANIHEFPNSFPFSFVFFSISKMIPFLKILQLMQNKLNSSFIISILTLPLCSLSSQQLNVKHRQFREKMKLIYPPQSHPYFLSQVLFSLIFKLHTNINTNISQLSIIFTTF